MTATKSQMIRCQNNLNEWIEDQIKTNSLDRGQMRLILTEKLHDMSKTDVHSTNVNIRISKQRLIEVAENLKDHFGVVVTPEQIDKHITSNYYMLEIAENTYTDTNIIEEILDILSKKIVCMRHPMFGDSEEYKEKYDVAAREKGFINNEDHTKGI
jgi:hypothetical protein